MDCISFSKYEISFLTFAIKCYVALRANKQTVSRIPFIMSELHVT